VARELEKDNRISDTVVYHCCGPGSIVGIATGYELDGPGIESRRGRDFPHLSRPALGPTQPPVQLVPGLSRGKERPGREADPSPPSSAVVKKGQSYTSTPQWAVRPVQSISACTNTMVHFTFTLLFIAVDKVLYC
jgi:hypothetical protein